MGVVTSGFEAGVSGCSVVPVFEVVPYVSGLDVAVIPESFVAYADGVLEGSDVVSDLPDSPAGCSVKLGSPEASSDEVESPVGVSDGVPDSSE